MNETARRWLYFPAVGAAVVTGAISLFLAGQLIHQAFHDVAADPLNSRELASLRLQIREKPSDKALQERFRQLDLQQRQTYFEHQARSDRGRWLLMIATAMFVGAVLIAGFSQYRPAGPAMTKAVSPLALGRWGRWSIGAFGVVAIGLAAWLGITARITDFPKPPPPPPPPVITPIADFSKNSPRFRGFDGSGAFDFKNVPTDWDAASGKNIKWKTALPLPGENSPVLWKDRIFLTGATEKNREVYCVRAADGKRLWTTPVKDVSDTSGVVPEVDAATGYAAPTVCVDGQHVFAIFANMDVVCLDQADGKVAWSRNVGPFPVQFGYASSLALIPGGAEQAGSGDKLLIVLDQGGEEDGKSKMLALDAATGKTAWEAKRPGGACWASPIVVQTEKGWQVITTGRPWVGGYDGQTGAEVWKVNLLSGDVAPSPVYANGLAYFVQQGQKLAALRIGEGFSDVVPEEGGKATSEPAPAASGPTTATKLPRVAWIGGDDVSSALPDICSPMVTPDGKRLYLLTSNGILTCVDAAKGSKLWDLSVKGEFSSSPTLAGGLVMITNNLGVTYFVPDGDSQPTAPPRQAKLGEGVTSCLAIADGRIYIRGAKYLYCIEAGK